MQKWSARSWGEKGDDRVKAVVTALVSRVGKEPAEALQGSIFTAKQVEAFEKLVRTTKAPGFTSQSSQTSSTKGWDENDPAEKKIAIAHHNAREKEGRAA